MFDDLPLLLTRPEVASFLRVDERAVDKMRAVGKLKSFYLGGKRVRFHRADVLAVLPPVAGRAIGASRPA